MDALTEPKKRRTRKPRVKPAETLNVKEKIMNTAEETMPELAQFIPKPTETDVHGFPRKFALIKMHPRRDENEVEDVVVCVEGKNISLQRGKWAPVNWVYVEALRHAAHPRFSQKPGEQRIQIGVTERFPFQGPYEITPEQYMTFRAMLKETGEITEQSITRITGQSV